MVLLLRAASRSRPEPRPDPRGGVLRPAAGASGSARCNLHPVVLHPAAQGTEIHYIRVPAAQRSVGCSLLVHVSS